jgi:hypothetical protein
MNLLRAWRFSLLLLFCLGLGLHPAPVAAATLSDDLAQILSGGLLSRVNVIVQTNGTPTSSLLSLVQLLGGRIYGQFSSINGFAMNGSLSLVTTLLARTDVERISPDRQTGGTLDLSSAAVGSTAVRQSTGLTGQGIGVAVLDTGVALHPDLATRI